MAGNVKKGDDALIGLPPGFRFHPTNEEIITHYLTPKVLNRSFTATAIGEADLNRWEPWDLPEKAKMMGENEWFFFCQRDRKYRKGVRTNRATKSGYWKATGKDKEILKLVGELIGMKKTLVFYQGRAPRGDKTNWVMHEFRLEGKFSYYSSMSIPSNEDEWVVCRVFHKSTGAQISSPASYHRGLNSFVEELLNSPPQLPLLLDHTIGHPHFSHDQPEILQNDGYKNILVSSSRYNFHNNTYQTSSFMSESQKAGEKLLCLTSESAYYSPNTYGLKKEKNVEYDQCKLENLIPTINQSRKITLSSDIRVSNDMTSIETSSTSMLSKDDFRTRDYDLDDDDDDIGPSMFSELDSLLQY